MTTYLSKKYFFVFLTLLTAFGFPVSLSAQAVRGITGDLWADLVLGPPNFGALSYNEVNASSVFLPSGLAADQNPAHHRLYVWDDGNSRILGFSDTRSFTPNTNGNQLGFAADIVIGQNNFTTGGCNGDNNNQNWPAFTPPTASSLCGMWQRQGSILEGGSGSNMAVDPATGDLYVADIFNNRVLRFAYADLTAGAMGPAASNIWGQPTANDFLANQGLAAPNNSTLFFGGALAPTLVGACSDPQGGEYGGVGIDPLGNLWVADTANNRVLRFPPDPFNSNLPKPAADLVLGQPSFNTDGNSNMVHPFGIRADGAGNAYVIDNGGSAGRVLIFRATSLSGQSAVAAADGIFTNGIDGPYGLDLDNSGHVWVVNIHNPYTDSTSGVGNVVMYQPDFAQATPTLNALKVLLQDSLPPTPPRPPAGRDRISPSPMGGQPSPGPSTGVTQWRWTGKGTSSSAPKVPARTCTDSRHPFPPPRQARAIRRTSRSSNKPSSGSSTMSGPTDSTRGSAWRWRKGTPIPNSSWPTVSAWIIGTCPVAPRDSATASRPVVTRVSAVRG